MSGMFWSGRGTVEDRERRSVLVGLRQYLFPEWLYLQDNPSSNDRYEWTREKAFDIRYVRT